MVILIFQFRRLRFQFRVLRALVEEIWQRLTMKTILGLAKCGLVLLHQYSLPLVHQLPFRVRLGERIFWEIVD